MLLELIIVSVVAKVSKTLTCNPSDSLYNTSISIIFKSWLSLLIVYSQGICMSTSWTLFSKNATTVDLAKLDSWEDKLL